MQAGISMVCLFMNLHKVLISAVSIFLVNEGFLGTNASADLNFEFEQRQKGLMKSEKMQKVKTNQVRKERERKERDYNCEIKQSKARYVSKYSNSMHYADILIDENGYIWQLSYWSKDCIKSVIRNSSTSWTTYFEVPPVKLGKIYKWVKRSSIPETGRVQFVILKGILYKINIGDSGRSSKCVFGYPVRFYQPVKARLRLPDDFSRDYKCER